MENFDLKKAKERLLNESPTHFFRVRYTAPIGWWDDTKEIIYTNMHFAPNNIVSDYEISYEGKDSKDEVYLVKIYSNVDKDTLQKFLDRKSTTAEKYTVL
jgi:hypothetical protein